MYLPYGQLYLLPKWAFLKYWISTVVFKVLFCTHASDLLQAIQRHATGSSKFSFYFILHHSSIQWSISFCLGSLFPPLFNSQLFFFNQYKLGQCKCYKTWGMTYCVQKQTLFSPILLASAPFTRPNKWIEISRGCLKGYVKEISSGGKKSGISLSL